jgi:predicted aldo/keto reductase-like oxidoreductase
MTKIRLGRTNLEVSKDAFGALPIQRASMEEAVKILRKALDGGINFFDTARGYSDSEEKIGAALSSRRNEFYIATKSHAKTGAELLKDLDASLEKLKTDRIDVYQFHAPGFVPGPGDESGLYDAALKAKAQGKIRFIGISNHKLPLAKEAVESGLFDTLQFPFSYLSSPAEIDLTRLCAEKNIGFIAMKALSGGLITDIFAARSWMSAHANVVPIWGIQRETELDELLRAAREGGNLTAEQEAKIEKDRTELAGEFCRGCGYCLPCPAEIPINMAARLSLLLKRSPAARFLTPDYQKIMARIDNCQRCGHCKSHCPYGLDAPALLEKNYRWYKEFLAAQ